MDSTLIFQSFLMLSGLEAAGAKPWLPLCRSAGASVAGRLRPDVDQQANRDLLCHAAAALAYYQYVMSTTAREESVSFRAGDVHIKEETAGVRQAARAVYESAMESVAHLMGEKTPFAFVEVVYK